MPVGNFNDPTIPASVKCNDGFTMALQQMTSTCNTNQCIGRDGNSYSSGQSETFYMTCNNLPMCGSNFRSAVVFDYQPVGTQFNPQAVCMIANTDTSPAQFSTGPCPSQVELDNQVFLNVDQQPLTLTLNGTSVDVFGVQIRAPLTNDCLINQGGQVVSAPCQVSPTPEWIYLPIIDPFPGNPSFKIPAQIIFNDPTVTDPMDYKSLQTEDGQLILKPMISFCDVMSTQCFGTGIISAEAWTCVNQG
jgi:hypothetical protein